MPSVFLHFVHLVVFRDLHHLLIYLWGDIAFIPLEVFFVSLIRYDLRLDRTQTETEPGWTESDYTRLKGFLTSQKLNLNLKSVDYTSLHDMTDEKQHLIMNLLTNQAMEEHEQFTESLVSVFHLLEEFKQRKDRELTEEDRNHLKVDTERVYRNLASGWGHYLVCIPKKAYPYLYASAVRTNPFLQT